MLFRTKLRNSQRWWLYWLEIFSYEERQFLLLLCEKRVSFVWCSEVEHTLNKCVDVRFCEHERLSIRRSNCDQLPRIEMDCLYEFEPQALCLLPLMTEFRACLNWWWRRNTLSIDLNLRCGQFEVQVSFRPGLEQIELNLLDIKFPFSLCFFELF